MNIFSFLNDIDIYIQTPIVTFIGNEYPLLFFSYLLATIKTKNICCKFIDLAAQDNNQLHTQASTLFLDAQQILFWCGSCAVLDKRKKKDFLQWVVHYKGPHTIWFFSDEPLADELLTVELPTQLTIHDMQQLNTLLFPIKKTQLRVLSTLEKQIGSLSLEQSLSLLPYMNLINVDQLSLFKEWLKHLIAPEQSLFVLSAYLFSKDARSFYESWALLEANYPIQFWLSFWSDQFFRAAGFIKYAQKKNFLAAKKIAYRLPFSFIKKDWQLHTVKQLIEAHNKLYDLDYHIKNGGSDVWIDLIYASFFI